MLLLFILLKIDYIQPSIKTIYVNRMSTEIDNADSSSTCSENMEHETTSLALKSGLRGDGENILSVRIV